jgi:predicted regulator of Ras-like GTPase activity (Roadblock/LC7/MglB family)
MDAQQALADLTEVSSQIEAAVVFDDKGTLLGSTRPDGDAFASAAADLLAAAQELETGDSTLTQLEIATAEGSVFLVREGKTAIAATTPPGPTVGLVFYDLKSALRNLPPKPPPRPRTKPKPKPDGKKKSASAKKATAKKPPAARRKKPDAP